MQQMVGKGKKTTQLTLISCQKSKVSFSHKGFTLELCEASVFDSVRTPNKLFFCIFLKLNQALPCRCSGLRNDFTQLSAPSDKKVQKEATNRASERVEQSWRLNPPPKTLLECSWQMRGEGIGALQATGSVRGASEICNWTLETNRQVTWPLMAHQAPQLVVSGTKARDVWWYPTQNFTEDFLKIFLEVSRTMVRFHIVTSAGSLLLYLQQSAIESEWAWHWLSWSKPRTSYKQNDSHGSRIPLIGIWGYLKALELQNTKKNKNYYCCSIATKCFVHLRKRKSHKFGVVTSNFFIYSVLEAGKTSVMAAHPLLVIKQIVCLA